jgi:hypothetical protein
MLLTLGVPAHVSCQVAAVPVPPLAAGGEYLPAAQGGVARLPPRPVPVAALSAVIPVVLRVICQSTRSQAHHSHTNTNPIAPLSLGL